ARGALLAPLRSAQRARRPPLRQQCAPQRHRSSPNLQKGRYTPRRFTELIRDRDPRKVKAVMEAMMTMVKLDVAELERAYNEA
ncbi:MAG: hypothetical protein KBD01_07415, partial [Acidobacteria bacterium]|nr:hypothetical protein [Acidobacteriota bacterium]